MAVCINLLSFTFFVNETIVCTIFTMGVEANGGLPSGAVDRWLKDSSKLGVCM